jgi:hypothetical protein
MKLVFVKNCIYILLWWDWGFLPKLAAGCKMKKRKQTNSVALSPQANYTDWATTTWRNVMSGMSDVENEKAVWTSLRQDELDRFPALARRTQVQAFFVMTTKVKRTNKTDRKQRHVALNHRHMPAEASEFRWSVVSFVGTKTEHCDSSAVSHRLRTAWL